MGIVIFARVCKHVLFMGVSANPLSKSFSVLLLAAAAAAASAAYVSVQENEHLFLEHSVLAGPARGRASTGAGVQRVRQAGVRWRPARARGACMRFGSGGEGNIIALH